MGVSTEGGLKSIADVKVAELEKVRCMLSHAKLSKTYWVETLMMAVYIINKSPSVPLDGDVPQRVWPNKDVLLASEGFGCLAHVHVAKDLRSKLDSKSWPCIFLGYGEGQFGYNYGT